MAIPVARETVWLRKYKYAELERIFYENLAKGIQGGGAQGKPTQQGNSPNSVGKNSLASEVAKARQHIKSSLECIDGIEEMAVKNLSVEFTKKINQLEKEKDELKKQLWALQETVKGFEIRLSKFEQQQGNSGAAKPQSSAPQASKPADDDDDGVDLFGSESEEDEEATKIKEARLAAYAAKKSKKPALIAKSSVVLDVKPWDDETDMKKLEEEVRKVATDGLLWGASKLVPLAYGIHKLQISCVVEDEKVSIDWLQETIQEIEDYVQSVDIAAFNKI